MGCNFLSEFQKTNKIGQAFKTKKNNQLQRICFKKLRTLDVGRNGKRNKETWSIVESKRLNFCVEILSRLAIIPSKMSVNKPIVNKIIAISL